MAIGIIGALEAMEGNARPDDNSVVPPIDRLASLPQALIMQMAQKGQIPKTMVPAVLAKKAENAQATAQIKAVAQQMAQQQQMGGPPPSTVIEKVMAQNAAQEAAPMNRSNVGIASAPMRPDMYRRGMAGGGIVAFQEGGGTFIGNLADRIFGDSLSQYGKSIDRAGALRRKQKFERIYGPDAVNFEEYNNALIELGIDPKSDLGGGVLAKTVPDFMDRAKAEKIKERYEKEYGPKVASGYVEYNEALETLGLTPNPAYGKDSGERGPSTGPLEVDITGAGRAPYEFETKLDGVREAFSRSPSEVNVTDDEVPFQKPTLKDTGLDNTAVDKKVVEVETGDKKGSGVDKLVDDTLKGIQDDRKPKSSDYADFAKKASKLSGEELAMLGLEFGLNLMGTKEKDFLTAVGQAGKPALKTALARQAERRKEARESKMMEKKFQNQRALLQDEIKSREKIGNLDRASREKLAAYRLKEVLERLNLSEKNINKKLVQSFLLNQRKDFKIMALETELLAETDSKKREDLRKQILELSAIRLRNDSELLGIDLDAVSTGGSGSKSKGNDPAGIR